MSQSVPDPAKAKGKSGACSRATRLSVLWDSQFLNYDNVHEERSRVRGQQNHALQTTYPNLGLLQDTIREKDKSANFPSTSCTSLQPGFLLTLNWRSSEHTSLCKLLPDSPLPSACLATPSSTAACSSWEADPTNSMDHVGEGVSWTRYALACSTCSTGYF